MRRSLMLRTLYFFIVECGIACFLRAMHVFEVLASSSSLGYLCAKFRFFCGFYCCASLWRKMEYSLTQSITQLIRCPENRTFCFGTSNVTGCHRGPKRKLRAGYRASSPQCKSSFSSSSVVSRAFSALCACSKFGIILIP